MMMLNIFLINLVAAMLAVRWLMLKHGQRLLVIGLLLSAMFVMAACGLRPVYQFDKDTGEMQSTILQEVSIDTIPGREGQILKNELEYNFGRRKNVVNATKGLRVTLSFVKGSFGAADVSNVNKISQTVVNAYFVLYEKSSGKVLDDFTISHDTSNVVVSLSGFAQDETTKKQLAFAMKAMAADARNRLLLSPVNANK